MRARCPRVSCRRLHAARPSVGRYFVVLKKQSVASRTTASNLSGAEQQAAYAAARASQEGVVRAVESAGGKVVYRYGLLVNAVSVSLSPQAAAALAGRSDVASVEPVGVVMAANSSSVPFIGRLAYGTPRRPGPGHQGGRGRHGHRLHARRLRGARHPGGYENNNPTFIEEGTFPTEKVIGGFDFVGEDYDVTDDQTNNDLPHPDPDPLDFDGHGTHIAGTCCGKGVPEGRQGRCTARQDLRIQVWDVGNSTEDVLVAAYERAVDPNEDGDISDAVDVLPFSGGVNYGTLNSVEAGAAQEVVDLGTVFVASAGNEGNQAGGWLALHPRHARSRRRASFRWRHRSTSSWLKPSTSKPTSRSPSRGSSSSRNGRPRSPKTSRTMCSMLGPSIHRSPRRQPVDSDRNCAARRLRATPSRANGPGLQGVHI